jgi:hypothetical protein
MDTGKIFEGKTMFLTVCVEKFRKYNRKIGQNTVTILLRHRRTCNDQHVAINIINTKCLSVENLTSVANLNLDNKRLTHQERWVAL